MSITIYLNQSGKLFELEFCSEHGLICQLFELILVIHANTNNETNHIV
jgi:hypothetical protein